MCHFNQMSAVLDDKTAAQPGGEALMGGRPSCIPICCVSNHNVAASTACKHNLAALFTPF